MSQSDRVSPQEVSKLEQLISLDSKLQSLQRLTNPVFLQSYLLEYLLNVREVIVEMRSVWSADFKYSCVKLIDKESKEALVDEVGANGFAIALLDAALTLVRSANSGRVA